MLYGKLLNADSMVLITSKDQSSIALGFSRQCKWAALYQNYFEPAAVMKVLEGQGWDCSFEP